jgi:hypothetical protein
MNIKQRLADFEALRPAGSRPTVLSDLIRDAREEIERLEGKLRQANLRRKRRLSIVSKDDH